MSRFNILLFLFVVCNKNEIYSSFVNRKTGFSESLKVSEVKLNVAKTQAEENKNDLVIKNTDLNQVANIKVSCGIRLVPETRIVGGNQSSPGRWPWQALLVRYPYAICGGVLINERWILTAAHCFDLDRNPRNHFIRLGAFNYTEFEDTTVDYGMTKIIIHNEYSPRTLTNDIALIELTTDVEFSNYIIPACLPDQDQAEPLQEECWISGWGQTRNPSKPMSVLREAKFPIIEFTNCSDILNEVGISINEKEICAGYLNRGVGTCFGDSGDPLVCRKSSSSSFVLQGINSFGFGGCASKYPDVFTRVSSFIEWIETITRNTNDDAFYEIPEQQCGSVVTTDGVFRLPTNTTTGLYNPNMNCIWTLIPDYNFNSRIEISFVEKMSIEAPKRRVCFDYVEVQVFPESSNLRNLFCGFLFPNINPFPVNVDLNTSINITFHSNGKKNYQGFALDVKFVERTTDDNAFYEIPEQQCGSVVTTDGVFRLPTNTTTGLYNPNMNCIWTLIPDYNFNSRIEISFVEKMSIEAPKRRVCFDYVEVQVFPESSIPPLYFCGFRFPDINPLSVDVNPDTTINITFHSNGQKNYQGFALEVKFVERTTVTCGQRLIPDSRIVGGNQSSPGRWPWQARLTYNSDYICGGTLINDRWVLTAAQCFANSITTERYKVGLGEFNYLEDESTDFEYSISQIRIHQNYDSTTFENDIALIELTSTVQFTNYIVPACLPTDNEIVPEGKRCWISGWENTESLNQPSDILREAEVSVLAGSVCANAYADGFNGIKQLCVGSLQQEIEPCNDDSGSPLVCEDSSSFVLQGIAGFASRSGCGSRDILDVYTRVSNYICWIDATMNDEDVAKCSGNKIQSHFYVAFLMFTLIVQLFWLSV